MKQVMGHAPGSVSTDLIRNSVGAMSAAHWASACANRLIELRPGTDAAVLRRVAAEMSESLAYFDPEIAAEMEHEGGMLDD